jgi:hypothetical protein
MIRSEATNQMRDYLRSIESSRIFKYLFLDIAIKACLTYYYMGDFELLAINPFLFLSLLKNLRDDPHIDGPRKITPS